MTTNQNQTTSDDVALREVEGFFAYVFGPDVLPVRSFDDVQAEMDFLEGGGVYASESSCQVCGANHAPFIVSADTATEFDGRVWRATCLDCYGQVRVPATVDDDNQWELHGEEADVVTLDPVPTYHEKQLQMEPEHADTDENSAEPEAHE